MSQSAPSILAKAKQLGAVASLAAAASAHAGLTLDYSVGGTYSGSGFFTGAFVDSEADGFVIDDGFKLWGEATRTDGDFWYYYDGNNQYYSTSTTGVALLWGGKITGETTYDDVLSAPYDFSTFFTRDNPGLRDTYAYASLKIGYSSWQYTVDSWSSTPASSGSTEEEYFDLGEPGSREFTGNISINLEETDAATDLYWFVQLELYLSHEVNNPSERNGDTFTLTVPQNSIDITFVPLLGGPTTPPVITPVPEPGTIFSGVALALGAAIAGLRRRRRA